MLIQLLLGRHGSKDHYLGGRYRPAGRPRRSQRLAFPLGEGTIHLFEFITPSQLREPVPARRIFPSYSSRYDLTALVFAQQVEKYGGQNYNAESRPSAAVDGEYARLHAAAMEADLAFFKRPTYECYLAVAAVEERFGALREGLIEENLEHFASQGHDVVARLGRLHSRVRRLARRGFRVRTRIGTGSFFPEQILKRRAIFGLPVSEEDRMRGYVDRFLRIMPVWEWRLELPSRRRLLALQGAELEAVHRGFDAAARASRALPELRDLLRIIEEATENGGTA
ncbi:MAG TPA: hypothetical protein VGH73_13035 [Thermoanaerobaculia bacterium]